jgi:membrane fusion protein, multidrug efflux system
MSLFIWSSRIGAIGFIFLGLVLTGCSSKVAQGPASLPEVATITVRPDKVTLTTELPGRTSAFLVAEIRPQVSGLLQERKFQEGANVKKGDILYQIDQAPYQAAYDQANAALQTAEANVATAEANVAVAEANMPAIRSRAERLKGLAAIHAVGQQDYDDANAALKQAEANLDMRKTTVTANRAAVEVSKTALESARINLSYTPIQAPITGRIGKSNITVGAMVTAYQGTPLAVIQQLDPIYVDVIQASTDLLRLRRKLESGNLTDGSGSQRKVKLLLEDGTPYPVEGTLQFRDVTVDPTTSSVTLRLVFANPKQVLLPGMFVRAVIEEGVNEQALLIPQQGVSHDLKGNAVALVVNKENKVEQRALELDRAMGDKWLVTKGLAPGDQVIVEGIEKVRAGVSVKTIEFTPAAKASAQTGANQSSASAK